MVLIVSEFEKQEVGGSQITDSCLDVIIENLLLKDSFGNLESDVAPNTSISFICSSISSKPID